MSKNNTTSMTIKRISQSPSPSPLASTTTAAAHRAVLLAIYFITVKVVEPTGKSQRRRRDAMVKDTGMEKDRKRISSLTMFNDAAKKSYHPAAEPEGVLPISSSFVPLTLTLYWRMRDDDDEVGTNL